MLWQTLSVLGRGAVAILLVALLGLFLQTIGGRTADAATGLAVSGTSVPPPVRMTWGVVVVLALGAGILAATALEVWAARREGAWPHWRALARGMGEAGFLLALLDALLNTRLGMEEISRLSATLAPGDLAAGLRHTITVLMAGAAFALLGLLGAGAIRLASR